MVGHCPMTNHGQAMRELIIGLPGQINTRAMFWLMRSLKNLACVVLTPTLSLTDADAGRSGKSGADSCEVPIKCHEVRVSPTPFCHRCERVSGY